jgi:hypothetical protein
VVNQDIRESTHGSQSISTGYMRTWSSSRGQGGEYTDMTAEWRRCQPPARFTTSNLPVLVYCQYILAITRQLTLHRCSFLNHNYYATQWNFIFKLL